MHGCRLEPCARRAGLTLIELLIVVAIVAILGSIAYPSFMDSIRKGRRADAVAALAQVQHAQERFRASRPAYSSAIDPTGTDPDALHLSSVSPDGHYTLALPSASVSGYVATATVRSGSPQESDALCRVFTITLDDRNGVVRRSSTSGGGASNSSSNNPCWVK